MLMIPLKRAFRDLRIFGRRRVARTIEKAIAFSDIENINTHIRMQNTIAIKDEQRACSKYGKHMNPKFRAGRVTLSHHFLTLIKIDRMKLLHGRRSIFTL